MSRDYARGWSTGPIEAKGMEKEVTKRIIRPCSLGVGKAVGTPLGSELLTPRGTGRSQSYKHLLQ